jgi:hypothetical protein
VSVSSLEGERHYCSFFPASASLSSVWLR